MHVIKDNPYRILGVLSNSGAKAIAANQGKIKAFLKTNRSIDFPNDFVKLLGTVDRTEDSVNNAFSAISLPKDKLVAGFFWFMSENSIDEIALNNLRNGDLGKAIEVQRKKKTVAACINLAVMYLLKEDWQKAIYYYAYLLSSKERREELLSIIADNSNLMTESEVVEIFCDEIARSFPKVDWYKESRSTSIEFDGNNVAIEDFLKDSNIGQYFAKEAENKVIKDLDALLNKYKKASDPEESLKMANNLKVKSHPLLHKMKLLFGKSNLRYKSFADKVANRILNLCIDYYNSDVDDPEKPRTVLQLTKYALRTAEGQESKARAQRNLDVIQKACDELPPEEVKEEHKEIDYLITNYKKQNNRLLLLSCVQGCENALNRFKAKLGDQNKYFVEESSNVVHFVINVIVDEVNRTQKAYNDAPEYLDYKEYADYKSCLQWAKPIMDRLRNFTKDALCSKRFSENYETLNNLYRKNCVATSSMSSSASSPLWTQQRTTSSPRPSSYSRPTRVTPPQSNNDDDTNWSGIASVFICVTIVIFAILIGAKSCESKTSSTSGESNPYEIVDTTVVDSGDDYYSSSNSSSSENSYYSEPTPTYEEVYYKTGDKPYSATYGKGRYDKTTDNSLKIDNGSSTDAVVFLETLGGTKVRHVFIKANERFTMSHIPAGRYVVKISQGNHWNPDKYNGDYKPSGGFMEDVSKQKTPDYDPFIYENNMDGRYRTYEITLYQVTNGNLSTETINDDELF